MKKSNNIIEKISFEINIGNEMENIYFKVDDDNNNKYNNDNLSIIVILDGQICSKVEIDQYNDSYNDFLNEIKNEFKIKYNEIISEYITQDSGVEIESEDEQDPIITTPYDPELINVTQGNFSLREIVNMINGIEDEESVLDLSPEFQRNFVWDNKRASRLIESILLQIPLPVFYFARDDEGKFQVVDGVQRLTVINDFFQNKFRLNKLEYLQNECGGKYFDKGENDSIHPKFRRLLRTYQIDCNIIQPQTPYGVKIDLFKRLNTGGKSLNRQEIRHSFMKPNVRQLINEMSESEEFLKATNRNVSSRRMADDELIVRYIGFFMQYNIKKFTNVSFFDYSGNMDNFLDSIINILNNYYNDLPIEDIKENFLKSMKLAYKLFNSYSFRKVEIDYQFERKNMINKSLFTSLSVLLGKYNLKEIKESVDYIDRLSEFLNRNFEFYSSITYATNDKIQIDRTFKYIDKFIKEEIGVEL